MAFLDNTGVEKLVALIKEKLSEYSKKNATVSDIYSSDAMGGHYIYLYMNVNGTVTQVASIPVNSASSSLPKMDGTASAGTGSDYARGNHVHPTDTSRQEKLVSGTNIKTINNNSLLGSGNIAIPTLPTVTASDNGKVMTVVDGAWSPAAGGSSGGGMLFIHLDENGVLDKTWKEIRDAPFAVLKIPFDEIYISIDYIYQTGYYVDGGVTYYEVATTNYGIFTTTSEDGYPVHNEE